MWEAMDTADLLAAWRDAVRAADMAERLAREAADRLHRADTDAAAAAEVAELARKAAGAAARAAERAAGVAAEAALLAEQLRAQAPDFDDAAAGARAAEVDARAAYDQSVIEDGNEPTA